MIQTKATAAFDWDSLLEKILRESTQGRMLPDAGRFEYFLKQKGELNVTPAVAERCGGGIILTASSVLLDGEQIGRFVKVYSGVKLMMLQYSGIVPGCRNGSSSTGIGNGEIALKYYSRRSNRVNGSGSNGFSIPFP